MRFRVLTLQAWQPNYNNSLNLWLAPPLLWLSLYLRYLHLPLQSAPLLWFRLLCLNSKQGLNSSLPQTSLVNKAPVGLSLTLVPYICVWSWSSSAAMRRKFSGLSSFSKKDRLWGGLRTSFARRQTLASFLSNPGPTLNNSSGVNSFQSMWKQILLISWKGLHTIKETGQWTITWTVSKSWPQMLDTWTPWTLVVKFY